MKSEQIRVNTLESAKARGQKITALTAYDYTIAGLVDEAGVDLILVGDSLANVMLGHPTTLPVTMEEMLHHTRAVTRAVKRALVVADLPFLSYQADLPEAIRNAGRFLKEAGAHAVKLEGGGPVLETVSTLVRLGIPVMGHLGFTPQSVHRFGSQVVQGKTDEQADELQRDALALEAAGAFSVVLECVPADLAGEISRQLRIPTIGIGAGPQCDGQILVFHDMVGLTAGPPLRFVKPYANLRKAILRAVGEYVREVRENSFPDAAHSFHSAASVAHGGAGER